MLTPWLKGCCRPRCQICNYNEEDKKASTHTQTDAHACTICCCTYIFTSPALTSPTLTSPKLASPNSQVQHSLVQHSHVQHVGWPSTCAVNASTDPMCVYTGGCIFLGWHVYFLGRTPLRDPPPPNPPSINPTQTKRVPICFFYEQTSICILINIWNWSVAELRGKNWDMDAHEHVTYQAPITGLHSPTLLPILHNSTDYLMLAQSCKFGVASLALTHPTACTECVCLWLLEMSTYPPYLLPNLL